MNPIATAWQETYRTTWVSLLRQFVILIYCFKLQGSVLTSAPHSWCNLFVFDIWHQISYIVRLKTGIHPNVTNFSLWLWSIYRWVCPCPLTVDRFWSTPNPQYSCTHHLLMNVPVIGSGESHFPRYGPTTISLLHHQPSYTPVERT